MLRPTLQGHKSYTRKNVLSMSVVWRAGGTEHVNCMGDNVSASERALSLIETSKFFERYSDMSCACMLHPGCTIQCYPAMTVHKAQASPDRPCEHLFTCATRHDGHDCA